jgi:hypothetical protein
MDTLFANTRPVLRYALALFWILSAITGMLDVRGWGVLLVNQLSIGMGLALFVVGAACIINAVVALFVFRAWKPRRLAAVQLVLVLAYTAIATLLFPSLWLEPLGPLLKNVPILAAIVAWGAMEEPGR